MVRPPGPSGYRSRSTAAGGAGKPSVTRDAGCQFAQADLRVLRVDLGTCRRT